MSQNLFKLTQVTKPLISSVRMISGPCSMIDLDSHTQDHTSSSYYLTQKPAETNHKDGSENNAQQFFNKQKPNTVSSTNHQHNNYNDLEGFDMYKDQSRYVPSFSKRGESGYDTALMTFDEWNKSMLHEFQNDRKGFAEMEVAEMKNGQTGETYSLSSM